MVKPSLPARPAVPERGAEAGRLADDADARLVADQILDVGEQQAFDLGGGETLTVAGTSSTGVAVRVARTVTGATWVAWSSGRSDSRRCRHGPNRRRGRRARL
jgi:hypothetical protein